MLDTPADESTTTDSTPVTAAGTDSTSAPDAAPRKRAAAKKSTAKKASAEKAPAEVTDQVAAPKATAKKATAKKATAKKATAKKATAKKATATKATAKEKPATQTADDTTTAKKSTRSKKPAKQGAGGASEAALDGPTVEASSADRPGIGMVVFQPPDPTAAPPKRKRATKEAAADRATEASTEPAPASSSADTEASTGTDGRATAGAGGEGDGDDAPRRRRRRGGRRRRKPGEGSAEGVEAGDESEPEAADGETGDSADDTEGSASTRRRRRRRRTGDDGGDQSDDPQKTVTRVRQTRSAEDQITSVSGSTRLEAKKQRRREGREAGRRRAPIVSEAEFLARRESVERVMVVRQRDDLTQIAVMEDKVLVEHYVARESQTSLIGNVYLGRVQNVLPSMEAAFIDIGKGRNAVLYAGEVNWSALGHKEGTTRKIESVLTSGQSVLVQVTKDPVGHKGARLTSQISLAGRFLVYVPDGTTSGISRKLPDTERNRLKSVLKDIVPDTAGVIVRTAAEGASEEELTRDVERLKARWEDIETKAKGKAPALLYGEPDLTLKVVRDLFTEDFARLVIEGPEAWDTVHGYVTHVAPDLLPRLERYETPESGVDVYSAYRIDEQIAKGLDRKVWLPSGGSLVIDRTEAMTVVDVNTGKFTGSGGNLEETVTKNNLEAAEEIVRQLRLRDIGGIIVVDFIDMVLESNRDLVLRRLVECLGRDRTRHQVAEVTSLGLIQMTRKRIGTGLLEAFSHVCEQCSGRGVIVQDVPVEPRRSDDESRRGGRRGRSGRGRGSDSGASTATSPPPKPSAPSPKDVAAVARPENHTEEPSEDPLDATEGEAPAVGGLAAILSVGDDAAEVAETPSATEPSADAAAEPEVVASAGPETAAEPESAAEPDSAAEPEVPEPEREEAVTPPEPPPAEPEAPSAPPEPVTVVTRSRRRSASRPAGPPVTGAVGQPPTSGTVEPGTVDVERGDTQAPSPENHVEHVPIKRRGTRKR